MEVLFPEYFHTTENISMLLFLQNCFNISKLYMEEVPFSIVCFTEVLAHAKIAIQYSLIW